LDSPHKCEEFEDSAGRSHGIELWGFEDITINNRCLFCYFFLEDMRGTRTAFGRIG
jgi:hypothetical protein